MDFTRHPKYLPDELNASTPEDIFCILKDYFKDSISNESIIVLMSHSALETGHWKVGLHRWNFGNVRIYPHVKELKDDEYFTMYRCSEIENGKEVFYDPPHVNSIFRAFLSKEDGIHHHIKFLKTEKYKEAWKQVVLADPAKYSHELKEAGYYTANEKMYKKTLVSVYNRYIKELDNFLAAYKKQKSLLDKEKKIIPPPLPKINNLDGYGNETVIINNDGYIRNDDTSSALLEIVTEDEEKYPETIKEKVVVDYKKTLPIKTIITMVFVIIASSIGWITSIFSDWF